MMGPTFDPREAIRQNRAGELSGASLLRALASHGGWHVPARVADGEEPGLLVLNNARGERWMLAFTDRQAMDEYEAVAGSNALGEHFAVLAGHALFRDIDDTLSGIDINALGENAVHYKREQFETLRRWARVIEVEQTLDQQVPDLGVLKRFDAYWMVLRKEGEGHQLVLAPDTQGRRLAPVFTAEDNTIEFLKTAVPALDFEPITVTLTGEQVFGQLRGLPLDGLVFNCRGPAKPRAFAKGFVDVVLNAR